MALPNRRLVAGLASLAALQGGAYLLYRFVNGRRSPKVVDAFSYEVTDLEISHEQAFEREDGQTFKLSNDGRRPVVLHFWATWCAPCRTELPTLLARFKETAELTSPRLLLVSVDENWETIRHYFGGKLPQQVARDPASRISRSLGVVTLPETFLLRRNGRAVARVRGARDWQSAEAQEALANLIGATKA